MNIAAYTLEDPTFPVDRVSSQVVNSLPCSVITNGHKELIFMKSFTLKEVRVQAIYLFSLCINLLCEDKVAKVKIFTISVTG